MFSDKKQQFELLHCKFAMPSNHKRRKKKLLRCSQWKANLRLSPTAEAFGNPNLKWVSNTIPPTEYPYKDLFWVSGEA
jgi:hypothetical protein